MNTDSNRLEEIEKLVVASQKADSDAFGKLYDLFIDQIYRYVYYRVGADDAEDLTELVFLKAWENIRQYHRGMHSFSSWIFRIAHNIVVDHYRLNKYATEPLNESLVDVRIESQTANRTHRALDREILSSSMKELKDEYRQILILKYINEFSNDEIAQIMDRNQAALRILQFRALRNLRKILENKGIADVDF